MMIYSKVIDTGILNGCPVPHLGKNAIADYCDIAFLNAPGDFAVQPVVWTTITFHTLDQRYAAQWDCGQQTPTNGFTIHNEIHVYGCDPAALECPDDRDPDMPSEAWYAMITGPRDDWWNRAVARRRWEDDF